METSVPEINDRGGAALEGDLAFLEPADLRLWRGPTGALRAEVRGHCSHLHVAVYRAFPLSAQSRYTVLFDGPESQAREIGMLRDPADLDSGARTLLEEELDLRYLTPHVTEVVQIREDVADGGGWSPALVWDLETDRGSVRLRLANIQDHIRGLGPGRLLITDRDGRRVEIPDIGRLSVESRARLGRYLAL